MDFVVDSTVSLFVSLFLNLIDLALLSQSNHSSFIVLNVKHYELIKQIENCLCFVQYIDGLVQGGCNSIANALELRLSCTNPSIYS